MWKYSVILAAGVACAVGAFAAPEESAAPAKADEAAVDQPKPERPEARRPREARGGERDARRPGAGLRGGFDAADTNDDGRLSFEEAQAQWPRLTEERFKALDTNDDGFVSREELPRAPGNRSRDRDRPSRERSEMTAPDGGEAARPGARRPGGGGEYWQRLQAADKDGDGIVSREEWQKAFGDSRMERFDSLRGDDEGGVRLEGLRERMVERGRGAQGGNRMDPEARRAYLERLIENLDKDGNGEVSWEEFQTGRPGASRQVFDRMDHNNDGVLSEADLTTP